MQCDKVWRDDDGGTGEDATVNVTKTVFMWDVNF